jgi:hypothetical protein
MEELHNLASFTAKKCRRAPHSSWQADAVAVSLPGGDAVANLCYFAPKESAMFNWLVGLWHRVDRWIRGERAPQGYHRSNLHGRHR